MLEPLSELMLGFASERRGTGALRKRTVFWQGAPSESAHGAGESSGTARGDRVPATESNIVAIWWMARSWYWPSVVKGATGDGLARAVIKSREARWASLAEDVWVMAQLCGKKSTVLAMHSAAVAAGIVLGVCNNVPAVNDVTGSGAADGQGFIE